MTGTSCNPTFYSRHSNSLVVRLSGWHHAQDGFHVRRINVRDTAQLALRFGGFLGQNVTLESVATLNGTTWTHAKTFFRGAFGFHFWHSNLPLWVAPYQTGLQVATLRCA